MLLGHPGRKINYSDYNYKLVLLRLKYTNVFYLYILYNLKGEIEKGKD